MTRSRHLRLRLIGPAAVAIAAACAPAVTAEPDVSAAPVAAGPPATSRDLVQRMRARHADGFYRTLVFRQQNVAYTSVGEHRSEWLEHQAVPGRLRIDFLTPVADGSGTLFRADSAYSFQNGRLMQAVPQLHPLLLLSADVYALSVDTTMARIGRLGIDTTRLRADRWRDRAVWVVGAAAGDSTSTQFWVDAERLLLVRLYQRQPGPGGQSRTTEYQFEYQDVSGVPVPREILFLRDGKPYFRETYVEARVNVPVADSLFDPARWAQSVPRR